MRLAELRTLLEALPDFTEEAIEKTFASFAEKSGLKMTNIAQPVRVAMTGSTASPGMYEVLSTLGKEKTLKRLDAVLAKGK